MAIFPIEALASMSPRPRIHFIGIGGVHMSAMAELLFLRGFPVTGNDREESDNVRHLNSVGVKCMVGHKPEYVEGADIIIRNAAIHDTSPDIIRARELGLPIYERPEVLGALMKDAGKRICIAGTHGKSTTTAMCSEIAYEAGIDPTVFCGARIPETGVAYRFGKNDLFIAESCEYCDSFLSFYPTHAVILNIEPDHLDYFSDIHAIRASFKRFASLVPEDGAVVANGDDPEIRKLLSDLGRPVIWTGYEDGNDYQAVNIVSEKGNFSFDILVRGEKEAHVDLAVPGKHVVQDALAAYAVSRAAGIASESIVLSLERFMGAKRRFERIGSFNGADVVDDFAHHPTELAATLNAAKALGYERVICVYQPHTYTRTLALYKEFAQALAIADLPILAPIYPAREENVHHISSTLIGDEMQSCTVYDSVEAIEDYVRAIAKKGDLIVTAGAGDIYKLGYRLVKA